MQPIHAASAQFAGYSHLDAVARCQAGVTEGFGPISTAHMQLCPQHHGQLTDSVVEELLNRWPDTQFRLHANVRVLHRHVLYDASCQHQEAWAYFTRLAEISKKLNAPAYTLHAGSRTHAALETLPDFIRRLNDLFECTVGVEGLYPNRGGTHLISNWDEYRWLLDSGMPYALDMSHLNIVAFRARRREDNLVQELLSSDRCIEVHLSGNDGRGDRHEAINADLPWWWESFSQNTRSCSTIFSEGQIARLKPRNPPPINQRNRRRPAYLAE